jgi:hypothetical protein
MNKTRWMLSILALSLLAALPASAHEGDQPITSAESETAAPEFDLIYARVTRFGSNLIFHQVVQGDAGTVIPEATGAVPGGQVLSYVWPTSLNSGDIGFEADQGIVALAVTAHPDFDDTPLWDEDGDGETDNDGASWHSHWVVLVNDDACGEGGLKVRDIPEGETVTVPETWPELPILIDSPNYALELTGHEVVVTVPHADVNNAESFNFDGVTAGLRVNANLHDPFLCVTGVSDIASGDLSLPGVMGS